MSLALVVFLFPPQRGNPMSAQANGLGIGVATTTFRPNGSVLNVVVGTNCCLGPPLGAPKVINNNSQGVALG